MTPQEHEIRTLRARVAQLEEQLGDARAEIRDLRLASDQATVAALHVALPGLTPTTAWLLAALYRSAGRPLLTSRILEEMPGNNPDRTAHNTVSVRIWQLRQVIGREAIKNHFGVGYSLTPAGVAACDAALRKAAA